MKKRHPDNTNLKLHYHPVWEGLPVLAESSGAMVTSYLEGIRSTVGRAVQEHPRTCVFHIVARLPHGYGSNLKGIPDRFIASLRAQIAADQRRRWRAGRRVHECNVRYVWCRERDSSGQPHYHIAILANRDAYTAMGRLQSRGDPDVPWWLAEEEAAVNMAARIQRAWSSALGLHPESTRGLVHFPRKPLQFIDARSPVWRDQEQAVFKRLSYFAKAATKEYGDRQRNFGYSRR